MIFVKFVLTKSSIMEMLVWIGYVLMVLIAIGIIVAIGYGVLFFLAATIGGVLTLIDTFKSNKDNQ